jgi:hypothetical protein
VLRAQGKILSAYDVSKIKQLLADTELSLQQIGARMECAKSTIVAINRRYGIRFYNGRRTEWILNVNSRASEDSN